MSVGDEYLVLGIIAAVVAGNAVAVEAKMRVLTRQNLRLADEVMRAIQRGLDARATVDSVAGGL